MWFQRIEEVVEYQEAAASSRAESSPYFAQVEKHAQPGGTRIQPLQRKRKLETSNVEEDMSFYKRVRLLHRKYVGLPRNRERMPRNIKSTEMERSPSQTDDPETNIPEVEPFRTNVVARVEPQAFMLDQDNLREDHLQLGTLPEDDFVSGFQDIFDFNAASLESRPEGYDVQYGIATSAADMVTGSKSSISPKLPTVSEAKSTSRTSTVNRAEYRHHCPFCMRPFRRRSDRDRHALIHNSSAPRYNCSFPGCDRVGSNGFLRRDKLTQHQAYKRH
jgi:hypothetical protein